MYCKALGSPAVFDRHDGLYPARLSLGSFYLSHELDTLTDPRLPLIQRQWHVAPLGIGSDDRHQPNGS
jgi:hypothetical protein